MKRQTLGQAVGEELLSSLRAGVWKPGDKLPPERELMQRFGVGRNALREGIQGLVRIGVLDVRPGVGTTVLSVEGDALLDSETISSLMSDHSIDDLYDLRLLLEGETARKAAETCDEPALALIRNRLEEYQEAGQQSGVPAYPYDVEFHRSIAQASGNALYVAILDLTADRLTEIRKATDTVPGAIGLAVKQHAAIYAAIAEHDAKAARRVMTEHIESGRAAVEAVRRRTQDKPA
jgi:DNA-binding FadR family transcriptional regulator